MNSDFAPAARGFCEKPFENEIDGPGVVTRGSTMPLNSKISTLLELGLSCSLVTLTACDDSGGAGPDGETESNGSHETEGDSDSDGIEAQCGERDAPDATEDELQVNRSAELDVGTALLAELGGDESNVLLSPYSLRMAFGQTFAGSQGDSRTEISSLFGFDALGPERVHDVLNTVSQGIEGRSAEATEEFPELIVRPINRSFLDVAFEETVDEDWLARLQASYGACLEVFDLNEDQEFTLEHINGWVEDQTGGLIPQLVKFLPERTTLVIVNALYFKASWAVEFAESLTQEASFTTWKDAEVTVDMMHAPLHEGGYVQGEGYQAVSIPYTDSNLDMVIVLPDAGTEADFESQLDAATLEEVLDGLAPSVVDLRLPKFDLMSTWTLSASLRALGLDAAFENGPDFEPIAPAMLPIFEVFHDVAIAIDEKGTEAAAATAVVFGEDGGEEPVAQAEIVVDHSFYLAIRDRQYGAILFFARIGDPTES